MEESNINFNLVESIAIVRRNGLGDVLCALPLLMYCKEKMPHAKISLFIDKRAEQLIPYLKGPDAIEILPYHKNKYLGLCNTIWKYRKTSFDLAISTKATPMRLMNFFLYGLNVKYRVAYVKDDWSSKLINCPQKPLPLETHQALKCVNLIDKNLTTIPENLYPSLHSPPKQSLACPNSIFISVTNRRVGSTLDFEKYVSLFSRLSKMTSFFPIINCEPQDREKAVALQKMLPVPSEVIVTETLADLLSLISSVSCLFIGDGGLMHLAAALNKPQVVLFGGTKIWEWSPLSPLAICLGDPHNVNYIPENEILKNLERLL